MKSIPSLLKNKYFLILISFVLLFPVIYDNAPVRLDVTQDKSLKEFIWVTHLPTDKNIIENKYFLFKPTKKQFPLTNKDIMLLKLVACSPGQELKISTNKIICDNKITNVYYKKNKSLKQYLEPFTFKGIIPKDKYFVLGTNHESYDSRYFGFIDKSQIIRTAKPLY